MNIAASIIAAVWITLFVLIGAAMVFRHFFNWWMSW